MLPFQQEADEIPGRDRLDLRPQPLGGIVVNPGQKPPFAPFHLIGERRVAPAHGEAFDLQRCHCRGDILRRQTQRLG